MEAPVAMLSPKGFWEAIQDFVASHYDVQADKGYKCKKCGAEIKQITCYVSLHDARFRGECAGAGKVEQVSLPYCPVCEGVPQRTFTCVHS